MRSIKPGRGPSAMGAAGSVFAIIFGFIWTVIAFNITKDAPFPLVSVVFPLFGIAFIGMGIVQAVYHFKNATSRNRMSLLDIVDEKEEPDPLNLRFGSGGSMSGMMDPDVDSVQNGNRSQGQRTRKYEGNYCPFCGSKVEADFVFCPGCGKEI